MFYNKSGGNMEKRQRQILHVDVNNAFLSWTAIDRLEAGETLDIRNIEAVIGGDESKRSGIVLAKSMKAKKKGVTTGETLYQARLKCPNLQVFKGEYKSYLKHSNDLYKILLEYTDKIERFSIDECFLDMTGYLIGDTLINKAYEINKRVKNELGFTVNVGVAHNKLLAKMASDFSKPDKVHTLYEEEIPSKMWALPVSELFMLGKKTIPKLYAMGIKTIGDLAKQDKEYMIKIFGKHGLLMWEYSNGIDNEGLYGYTNVAKIHEESITISARGTIGYVCLRLEPYVPIVRLISIIPNKKELSAKYLYLWALTQNITGTGTTQQQLTVPIFRKTPISIPSDTKLKQFNSIADPLFSQIESNKKENIKLSTLRDTLLPKLMSGELSVEEVSFD